jgi:hypothetical protein
LPTSKTAIAVFCHQVLREIARPQRLSAQRICQDLVAGHAFTGGMARSNVSCPNSRTRRSRRFAGWSVRRVRSCRWISDRERG